jgi:predicted TIM-barrel fold metal-dependent hydrolase
MMQDGRAPIVDCDVHCAVPSAQTLYPYLSAHWPDFLDASEFWHHHGGRWTYPAWSNMLNTEPEGLTLERLQAAVLDGVDAAILHCHYGVDSIQHPYLAPELQRAVNSWVRDEWLDKDSRLLGSIAINPSHTEAAVEEIERAAEDKRFVQVLLPVRSREEYGNQRYWPIWEAAAKHDLVLALTFGGSSGQPPTTVNWMNSFFEDYAVATLNYAPQIMSFIVSGVLQKWPSLRLAVVESGWSWIPGFSWRMDAEWKAHVRELPWVTEAPSTYMRRHFRFTTQPSDLPGEPEQIAHALEQLGNAEVAAADLLLYSSDYPHRYQHGIESLLQGMSDDESARVMGGNAWDWYGLTERVDRPVAA